MVTLKLIDLQVLAHFQYLMLVRLITILTSLLSLVVDREVLEVQIFLAVAAVVLEVIEHLLTLKHLEVEDQARMQ
jgi:hypothetical protein